jgi:hypothetical protein
MCKWSDNMSSSKHEEGDLSYRNRQLTRAISKRDTAQLEEYSEKQRTLYQKVGRHQGADGPKVQLLRSRQKSSEAPQSASRLLHRTLCNIAIEDSSQPSKPTGKKCFPSTRTWALCCSTLVCSLIPLAGAWLSGSETAG